MINVYFHELHGAKQFLAICSRSFKSLKVTCHHCVTVIQLCPPKKGTIVILELPCQISNVLLMYSTDSCFKVLTLSEDHKHLQQTKVIGFSISWRSVTSNQIISMSMDHAIRVINHDQNDHHANFYGVHRHQAVITQKYKLYGIRNMLYDLLSATDDIQVMQHGRSEIWSVAETVLYSIQGILYTSM